MASRSDGITRLYEVPQVPEPERLPQPPKTKDKVLLDERGLLDLPFLALTVLLVLIGVVMVFSASYARAYYLKGNSTYYFARQAIFAVAGIGGMLFVSRLNYQLWRSASFIILGVSVVFLMLVPIIGSTANGAKRWIEVAGIRFQPSELAKIAIIMTFSAMISTTRDKMRTFRYGIAPFGAIMIVLCGLVALERHFSCILIMLLLAAAMLFLGGVLLAMRKDAVLALIMLVFVPVFAGVIAAMGKAAAASAANTVILAAAQFFSQISVNFLTPVCGTVMGLSVTGAIHPEMSTDKLGELIRKAAVWGLSLLMTVFMSVLSAQTFVTNSADNVLIRTAKFAVSSGVPIVGGTISDAVNTVHASLSLMHSSIGTYGIAAGIVILLPSLISVVCYRFALTAAEAVSEVFGVKELSTLFRACGAVMSIIMAVIVCFLLLNTISAVIMLAAGSSQA